MSDRKSIIITAPMLMNNVHFNELEDAVSHPHTKACALFPKFSPGAKQVAALRREHQRPFGR